MKKNKNLKVSIVMGSNSDYSTMKFCEKILKLLKINYDYITRIFKHKLLGLSRPGIGGKREQKKYWKTTQFG